MEYFIECKPRNYEEWVGLKELGGILGYTVSSPKSYHDYLSYPYITLHDKKVTGRSSILSHLISSREFRYKLYERSWLNGLTMEFKPMTKPIIHNFE